jgi:primary-amine oxidase
MTALRTRFAPLFALLLVATSARAAHPLDGLRPEEYRAVREILAASGDTDNRSFFAMIRLEEPDKAAVLAWEQGAREAIPRVARVSLRKAEQLFDARVDLDARAVIAMEEVRDAQSSILLSEFTLAQEVVVNDGDWRDAMRKRGYAEIDSGRFMCLPFAAGYFAEAELEGRRLVRVQCMDLEGTQKHLFQRPIEGLTAIVDLNEKAIVKLIDDGVVPVPEASGNYDEASLRPYKPAMNPIEVILPDGPTYGFDGSFVELGSLALPPAPRSPTRPGCIPGNLRGRSVMYQASLSEMWVPYMDPASGWFFKNYFDAGEYGFGLFATPLTPGVDCPPHATFHDYAMGLDDAEPVPYANSMCLFERPTMNPAWRHAEGIDGSFGGRPARELVVRMIAAIGNYDYVSTTCSCRRERSRSVLRRRVSISPRPSRPRHSTTRAAPRTRATAI